MGNNLPKPVNLLRSAYSFMQSRFSGSTYINGLPPAVGIELTNHCNLKCPECNTGAGRMTRPRGYISINLLDKILAELGPCLYNINLYFQGESMMHPQFFQLLNKCSGIHTTLSTNGHFLSPEKALKIAESQLGTLIISLDGMDQETYSIYRSNGDFQKVKEGILNIASALQHAASDTKLVIQFLVNKSNEHQIIEAKRFARRIHASLKLKSMQIISTDSFQKWLPANKKLSRYEQTGNGYSIKNVFPNRCARLWFNPVITWDGNVLPCCFDKDGDHIMGNINEESFSDIWNGPRFRLFRKSLLSDRKTIGICRNCTSGLKT